MKIFITGANGQLGRELQRRLQGTPFLATDVQELDITDAAAVSSQIGLYQPDLVVHGAAWTQVDLAERTGGPARYVRIGETGQKIGFITPLTHNFCESCNRVRVTCTGELYMCLGQEDRADLRAPLRASEDNAALNDAIRAAIARKPKGHDFDYSRQHVTGQVSRHMSHTGG